jgi:endonuclease/exonuclease/phosphatase family metal-dependent hydrolase
VDVSENWGTYHAYEQYGSEIDFIFHDAHSEAVRYDIVTKQYDGYISDHYGVIVDFVPVTNG